MTRTKFVLALAVLVSVMAARSSGVSTVAAQQAGTVPTAHAAQAIAILNDCIQARFKEDNVRFGVARVMKPGATPHQFEPENVRELEAVRGLESVQLRVVLYLAGRHLLGTKPPAVPELGGAGLGNHHRAGADRAGDFTGTEPCASCRHGSLG